MTVEGNLSFGLKNAKMPKDEIQSRVQRAAKILQIEALLKRKPGALSGGQRQRVAIGRALVRDVDVFLFDEPLSNLDAKLRVDLRVELKLLHQRLKNTMIYVTHDQIEAMTLADRIAIMNEGEVVQFGSVEDLVLNPATDYVRDFTKEIPKEKFLTVGSVMGPISENIGTLSFRTRDLIADIAAEIIQSEFSACVIDDAGQNVGSLTRDQVVKIVFPNEK